MVELIAELINNKYNIWILSASNVWSVRYLVLKVLNEKLAQRGIKEGN